MLQLVNCSNYTSDVELIHNNPDCLQAVLNYHHLDGLEMMFCAPWNKQIHKKKWIQGVHLRFWPCWLEFWRGDQQALMQEFGSIEKIKECYGGLTREAWLDIYRQNIRIAKEAGAKYLVFHVSHTRTTELFNWQFGASDCEVVEGTIEVINELAGEIPADMALLFENLWWPGLTLRDKELVVMLLEKVRHSNVGIMLDTGHLMNTNPTLKSEAEGIEYILATLSQLGDYSRYIRGIHLHHSLSGEYIQHSKKITKQDYTMAEVMSHVLKIDEHLPFSIPSVQRIVDALEPDYLVHEFLYTSIDDWVQKIGRQQQALQRRKDK